VTISQAADTAGLAAAWRELDPSSSRMSLGVDYAPTGLLLNVLAADTMRPKSDWTAMSSTLRPFFRDVPAPGMSLRLLVLRDSNTHELTLLPVPWTCHPLIKNLPSVAEAFRSRIAELRRRGFVPSDAGGRVAVTVALDERGQVVQAFVGRPGPYPAIDSLAVAMIDRAQFVPGVRGRVSASSTMIVPFRY